MKRLVAVIFLFLTPLPAFADTTGDPRIQMAFLFARQQLWSQAIEEAKAAHNRILTKYFTWQYLKDPQSDASFNAIAGFIEENPQWPDQDALRKHAEVALMADNPSDATLNEWFRKYPPKTNTARLREAKSPEALRSLIRAAWVEDDYDKATEEKLLDKYHAVLRSEDHIRRVDRLLWEGKDDEAKRLLKWVPYDYQRLFQARIALGEEKQRAPIDLVNVPPALKSDPGLVYERIRWRAHAGDKDGVRELLLTASAVVPYPEKWWVLRDRQIREAIGEGNITLAERLLARHGQKSGTIPYKEAEWLNGWIKLEFRKQPSEAYRIFSLLLDETQTPAGRARVAYWLARAAEKSAKGDNAARWFAEAAHYPTTFYGQLAAWEIHKDTPDIASNAAPTMEEKKRFDACELTQLVYALGAAHETDEAGRFIMYLAEHAKTSGEAILAARLGRDIHRIDYSVRAAKKILQNDIVSLENGWPVIATTTTNVEKPLLLALMRQESEFFADAVSASGAVGLMQLLPHTAREIARKSHMPYSNGQLFKPDYNMVIGSLYLNKMLAEFGGSYVLAVASYNAGPGRVKQWLDDFGMPGTGVRGRLNWIERIPTSETRNYVEHVLENTQVYRYILAGKTPEKLRIAEDLTK